MKRVIACVACGVLLALCQASAALRVASTRAEYEAHPLGIGPRAPRLSEKFWPKLFVKTKACKYVTLKSRDFRFIHCRISRA